MAYKIGRKHRFLPHSRVILFKQHICEVHQRAIETVNLPLELGVTEGTEGLPATVEGTTPDQKIHAAPPEKDAQIRVELQHGQELLRHFHREQLLKFLRGIGIAEKTLRELNVIRFKLDHRT